MLNAQHICNLHSEYVALWHNDHKISSSAPNNSELDTIVLAQHRCNFDLWNEEDNAREVNASDTKIATVKRNIDKLNQKRNDLVTDIDLLLAQTDLEPFQNSALPWNSETIGSIIDRLSIASLKSFYMRQETLRQDAKRSHILQCQDSLIQIELQRDDLSTALQIFIDDIVAGRKQNKLYRQFKMYNDPTLNPKIYNKNK